MGELKQPERDRYAEASQAVAKRFSRAMNASCYRWGVCADPALIGLASAVTILAALGLHDRVADRALLWGLAALPLAAGIVAMVLMLGARKQVVAWLARVPFAVQNMNGLLNGVGKTMLIRFAGKPPARAALNERLEQVSHDCFALEYEEDDPLVEVSLGVLPDSKINPSGAHYRRLQRVKALVEEVLVPLAREHPIAEVHIC